MEAVTEQAREYLVFNGTYYDNGTPGELIKILEKLRIDKVKVRVFQGFTESYPPEKSGIKTSYTIGQAWPEENDVLGFIARSMGNPVKAPLLMKGKNSVGGHALSTRSIVGVLAQTSNGRKWLYKHPLFSVGVWEVKQTADINPVTGGAYVEVHHNGELHARFATEASANRYAEFMRGNRFNK